MKDIAGIALVYFQKIFTAGECDRMDDCLNAVPYKITTEMHQFLTSEFSVDEVKAALFQMTPTKVPGPDVYETIHTIHSRKKGKTGSLALKLDVSKAYDRVEWDFLHGIMTKLGFPGHWIRLVMACVSSPSFSILINGKPFGNITPSRGLRQGDPLSPYLFLLCAEVFTSLLAKAELEGMIHGVAICRGAPMISHLLFADDSWLFCKASQKEVQVINELLQTYADASGQMINMEKSLVFFSNNTLVGMRDWIKAKLAGWKGKLLSKARKEVLIKVVAQSIPTYTMGVFQLPKKLCDDLNTMCANFCWGQVDRERKIHLQRWGILTQAKKFGGMGFRDLKIFNLAMLAKQGWRLLQNQESLVFKCLKACYFPCCSFLEAVDSPTSSYIWKSIMAAQPVLKKGCCWMVGDGTSIQVMFDSWIPNHPTNKILIHPVEEEWEWRVSDLMEPELRCWNREIIMSKFHKEDAKAILRIPLSRRLVMDSMMWLHTAREVYSVKSGYYVATQCSSLGAIIHNENGEVMGAMSAKGPQVRDNIEVEVLACRRALEFAIDIGFLELWVEVKLVKKDANGVAHSLARFAKTIVEDIFWLKDSPPPALEALYVDSLQFQ
nr:uncharacterized protein LOC112036081 [Quercus suber]